MRNERESAHHICIHFYLLKGQGHIPNRSYLFNKIKKNKPNNNINNKCIQALNTFLEVESHHLQSLDIYSTPQVIGRFPLIILPMYLYRFQLLVPPYDVIFGFRSTFRSEETQQSFESPIIKEYEENKGYGAIYLINRVYCTVMLSHYIKRAD